MARYPTASITGMDSSEDMVRAAHMRLPSVSFEVADIATWQAPGPYDVILANAVLHWVRDHAALLPRLVSALSTGGSLAVQMPDNLAEPSHLLMQQVARDGPWAAKLAGAQGERSEVAPTAWYYQLLRPHCSRVDVWRTTYHHPLPGHRRHRRMVQGHRPASLPLAADPEEQAGYLSHYRAALARAYPLL